MDSMNYVVNMIYDHNGDLDKPNPQQDLYHTIQTLTYLYQQHPEWDEDFKRDIKEYTQQCIDLLMKI